MRNLESSNTLNTHEGVDDSSSSAVSGPALQRPIPQREAQGLSAMVRWPLVLGGSDMVVPSLVTDQNRMQLMQSSAMHIGKEPTVAPWNPRTKKGAPDKRTREGRAWYEQATTGDGVDEQGQY